MAEKAKTTNKHAAIRKAAAERIAAIVKAAVQADASLHTNEPELVKAIDHALDEHVFKPLFT